MFYGQGTTEIQQGSEKAQEERWARQTGFACQLDAKRYHDSARAGQEKEITVL